MKKRIEELEKIIEALQARIVALEARPLPYYGNIPINPIPYYPYQGPIWTDTTTTGPLNPNRPIIY